MVQVPELRNDSIPEETGEETTMQIKEMKAICKPLSINVECRWGDGFQVSATDEATIKQGLEPLGFKVKGIGIGYDYNRKLVILYVVKNRGG